MLLSTGGAKTEGMETILFIKQASFRNGKDKIERF
jgi:hypothetical protein